MSLALVSCIIPAFNAERYIAETLDSVAAQTHEDIEIIVVDDGSTDDTAGTVNAWAAGRKVRCVLLQQANGGHGAARNRGIESAHGEFIAFTDADDLWHPEKIERQLRQFDASPSLGAVFAHLQNFVSPESARVVEEWELAPLPAYSSAAMLVRRAAFDLVGQLDASLRHGNDRDWILRARERGVQMAMLPDVLVRRRLHDTNRSSQLGAASRSEYLRILKASLDRRRSGDGAIAGYDLGSSRDK